VDVEKLRLVYEAVRTLGGRGGTREVASLLGLSERQVRRYISVLVAAGYVEPVRRGMRVFYRVARPATEADLRGLAEGSAEEGGEEGEAEIYRLARAIDQLISESGAAADLVGAAKIHLLVPSHERITHDVDVLVTREHARLLVSLVKHALGLVEARSSGVHIDYRLRHPLRDIEVKVIVGGFREELAAPFCGGSPPGATVMSPEPLTGGASPLRPHRQRWGGADLIPCHGRPRPTQQTIGRRVLISFSHRRPREEGRVVWDLSHILRRGRLWLEHAVVAKLSRRGFRDVDAYDVAVSLPHIEPGRFAAALGDLGNQSPELVERVWDHLSAVEGYIRAVFAGEEGEVYLLALRRLRRLDQGESSQAERKKLRN